MSGLFRKIVGLLLIFILLVEQGCKSPKVENPLFVVLDAASTGLHFTNKLTATPQFNMFDYMYFYNGAGIGAGDFNKDGLIDLFFSANQAPSQLYLNKGNLKFEDVTDASRIQQDGGWSTGVSIIDINNDGLLDIYVCKVGNFEMLKGKNQLFICEGIDKDGVPYYSEQAKDFGIDFSGFCTQASFFDYDMDGDLDLFLLNHSVHQNGTFAMRASFLGTYHPLSGDRIYRNDGNRFTDVTKQTGINSSAISYGLGMAVSDINLDGYPDLYIGNDFHENDYLYINQRNGTFTEEVTQQMMHTSQFSMGVDVADINNDAYPEVIVMDMLPSDPYILKRSLGEDEFNVFNLKIGYGYNHQYTRNSLQLNRRNGVFSEIGMYAGVFATDWSWAPLWMDFDNDGLKDLFVSNGIPKRLNDIDYVNYVSNDEIQQKIRDNKMAESDMALIDKFPQIKLPNKFFKNMGNAAFKDLKDNIENDLPTFSNGSVYADLDNDGDLDIVVNNIDDPVLVYQNKTNDAQKTRFLKVDLKGPLGNINALGAKAIVYAKGSVLTYEKYPVRGFQSSMEVPLHIGYTGLQVDSIALIWPDNTYQSFSLPDTNFITLTYKSGLPGFDYNGLKSRQANNTLPMEDITESVNLIHAHEENNFVEFDREPLIPFMVSKEGPALAVGDFNGDGKDDVFIGASKGKKNSVWVQGADGILHKTVQPEMDMDSTYEDVDACWLDVNNDKRTDLVVASGGNEYYGTDDYLMPRVYLNDGKEQLRKLEGAFTNLFLTASCVTPIDLNKDGAMDLFIGGRAVPWAYGQIPKSYLLLNNGKGYFKDVTASYCNAISDIGFVKDATPGDIDKDGDQDLVVALEWGGVYVLVNTGNQLEKKSLSDKKGWWNFVLPVDVDGDGDLDLVAGNQGLNNRFSPNEKEPVRLYFSDFDGNGKKEQVLTYYLNGKEIPFANKDELQKQLPVLRKRFLYAEDLAKASLTEIFTVEKLNASQVLTADYFLNSVFINNGSLNFTLQPLPWEAQLTPFKDAVVVNANGDQLPDLLMVGNFYENNIQMGRYDADYGTLLINKGNGNFMSQSINGLNIRGQVRHITPFKTGTKQAFILVRNNDSTKVIAFK